MELLEGREYAYAYRGHPWYLRGSEIENALKVDMKEFN